MYPLPFLAKRVFSVDLYLSRSGMSGDGLLAWKPCKISGFRANWFWRFASICVSLERKLHRMLCEPSLDQSSAGRPSNLDCAKLPSAPSYLARLQAANTVAAATTAETRRPCFVEAIVIDITVAPVLHVFCRCMFSCHCSATSITWSCCLRTRAGLARGRGWCSANCGKACYRSTCVKHSFLSKESQVMNLTLWVLR